MGISDTRRCWSAWPLASLHLRPYKLSSLDHLIFTCGFSPGPGAETIPLSYHRALRNPRTDTQSLSTKATLKLVPCTLFLWFLQVPCGPYRSPSWFPTLHQIFLKPQFSHLPGHSPFASHRTSVIPGIHLSGLLPIAGWLYLLCPHWCVGAS